MQPCSTVMQTNQSFSFELFLTTPQPSSWTKRTYKLTVPIQREHPNKANPGRWICYLDTGASKRNSKQHQQRCSWLLEVRTITVEFRSNWSQRAPIKYNHSTTPSLVLPATINSLPTHGSGWQQPLWKQSCCQGLVYCQTLEELFISPVALFEVFWFFDDAVTALLMLKEDQWVQIEGRERNDAPPMAIRCGGGFADESPTLLFSDAAAARRQ